VPYGTPVGVAVGCASVVAFGMLTNARRRAAGIGLTIAMTLRSSLKERLRASREKPAPKPVASRKALAPKPEWNVRPLSSERFPLAGNISAPSATATVSSTPHHTAK
jgi:hypothetical protein